MALEASASGESDTDAKGSDGDKAVPSSGAAVFDGDDAVGEVTRAETSPMLEYPIALATVEYGLETEELTVRVDGEEVPAERTTLPFVEGSDRPARLPNYE